jgi:3-methylcrotonyl-CoA carboxylase alpha subunit
VYSEADAGAPHTRLAHEAHLIGPAPARESYLVATKILDVARRTGAACIHPGYGFLSENADFAEACVAANVVFVGPPPSAIRAMGLKDAAKALVEKAGVPVVPGYHGAKQEAAFLRKRAENIGFPVLIKAVAGGGGKGMKRVDRIIDFEEALSSAKREAKGAFGDEHVLVEKYITAPRHVEIQVFGDSHGNVVHLFERDCSMQRRHQKVIEEAPAPGMPPQVRAAMGKAAVEAAKAVGYVGAGTVEFIADGSSGLRPDGFYFMEMNTRLQVEHPVTEMITGLDLVELQFLVAGGGALPFTQEDLSITGHAVEARVYAEDPERGFLPSTGKLWALRLPDGDNIRVDSGVEEGGAVTPHYDPMIAKVIAHGATRDDALDALTKALAETTVAGPRTNVAFLGKLINHADFRAAKLDTGLIERNLDALGAVEQPLDGAAIAAAMRDVFVRATQQQDLQDPWGVPDSFRLSGDNASVVTVLAESRRVEGRITATMAGPAAAFDHVVEIPALAYRGVAVVDAETTLVMDGETGAYLAIRHGRQTAITVFDPLDVDLNALDEDSGGAVRSPMHGKVIAVFVGNGERVEKGQRLAIVEAMKMEHVLAAPRDGIVVEIAAEAGAQVADGERLMVIGDAP